MSLIPGIDQGGMSVWKLPDEQIIVPVVLFDANGDPLTTIGLDAGTNTIGNVIITDIHEHKADVDVERGALLVQETPAFKLAIAKDYARATATTSTLSVQANPQDTQISIQGGDYASFNVGDQVKLTDTIVEEFNFSTITVKPGSPVLTLDFQLDGVYPIGSTVTVMEKDLTSAAGTLGSPVSYVIQPPSNQIWDITSTMLLIEDNIAMDSSKFGGMAALTNGTVIRFCVGGAYFTFADVKTNGAMQIDSGNLTYSSKGAGGENAVFVIWDLVKFKSPVRLNGENGDFLETLIQDDITPLSSALLRSHGFISQIIV